MPLLDASDFARDPLRRADPPGSSRNNPVAVSDLNAATRTVVEENFDRFWVRGEVSSFRAHANGHWYFCLRDRYSQIRCVVWAQDQFRMPAAPDDGMQITALAQLTVYPARGELQLRVGRMEALGDGLWRKAMHRTLERLRADGLLADDRKRRLPRFPSCIAVVTSPSGAALRDIIAIAARRNPSLRLVLAPATVQGDAAPLSICGALRRLSAWNGAEIVILGRGGGSREDLWAFNDERVARAVASFPVPVISAVGHEIDTTICDLVADVRVATPSAAAEAAIPLRRELERSLEAQRVALTGAAMRRVAAARSNLAGVASALGAAVRHNAEASRSEVSSAASRLHALSPLATLARGYAVALGTDGRPLASVREFAAGELFELILHDGRVRARTEFTSSSVHDT